jgi:hypothetical protein
MGWTPYRPAMPLAGKYIRIAGRPGQYNEARNYFDARTYRLPAGLVGRVESITPFKVRFDKAQSNNRILWSQINPAWFESVIFVDIDRMRFNAIEVGQSASG